MANRILISDRRGTAHHANGDVYEGEYKGDKKEGHGVMHFSDGNVYEGAYKGGVKAGGYQQYYMVGCKTHKGSERVEEKLKEMQDENT